MLLWALRFPQRFQGVGRLGWQASIVRQQPCLVAAAATLIAKKGLSPAELGGRVGCSNLAAHYQQVLATQALALARGCSEAVSSGLWDRLPAVSKASIVERVRREGEPALATALARFDDADGEDRNVRSLATAALSRDGATLLDKFLASAGAEELRFIGLCGAIAGIYAGVIEVIMWGVYPSAWLPLPITTAVGCGTSWLALRMLLRPHRPTKYFWAVSYQGLLPKRRRQLLAKLAASVAHEAATDRHLIGMLTDGQGGRDLSLALRDAIDPQSSHGDAALERIRESLADQVVGLAPQFTVDLEAYHEFEEKICSLLSRRLMQVEPPELEALLANLLAPDTAVLVAAGGGFGALVGILQAVLLAAI